MVRAKKPGSLWCSALATISWLSSKRAAASQLLTADSKASTRAHCTPQASARSTIARALQTTLEVLVPGKFGIDEKAERVHARGLQHCNSEIRVIWMQMLRVLSFEVHSTKVNTASTSLRAPRSRNRLYENESSPPDPIQINLAAPQCKRTDMAMATLGAWVGTGAHRDIVELVLGHVLGTSLHRWTHAPREWHAVTRCVSKAFTECLTRAWENSDNVPHHYCLLLQNARGSWHTYALHTGVYCKRAGALGTARLHLAAPQECRASARGLLVLAQATPLDNNARLALLETGICIDTRKPGCAPQKGAPGTRACSTLGSRASNWRPGRGFACATARCVQDALRLRFAYARARVGARRAGAHAHQLQLFPNTSRRARLRVHPRAPWNAGHAPTARGAMKWLRESSPTGAFVRVRAMITRWARKLCKEPLEFMLDDLGLADKHPRWLASGQKRAGLLYKVSEDHNVCIRLVVQDTQRFWPGRSEWL